MLTDNNIEKYRYTLVPRDPDVLLKDRPTAGGANPTQADYDLYQLPFLDIELIRRSKGLHSEGAQRAHLQLQPQGLHLRHGARAHAFSAGKYDPEAYYLCCLFHDIGTADRYLSTTKMSFEFKGAIVAREFILEHGGEEDLADAVCEAIIRHQDIFVKGGNITAVGQVLQLATIIDNVGLHANLISKPLIEATVRAFPRLQWANCFAGVIYKELALKSWCHTSTFEVLGWKEGIASNFARDVKENILMNQYDQSERMLGVRCG
ncbi:hypothetical protein NM688_g8818 [Phlebia brevispora]|uniref:Uncharacterized protein n=1 Tax=Phlebia brevispora TaxID=194682 RepID=A0ACC1RN10_9APHY|nr:hypothetical protein NM688_g8818 [Phlebia brevispora]